MIRESLNHQITHLVSMQYSTVEIRHLALEDVLAGPEGLHRLLPTRLGEVRAMVKEFTDARLQGRTARRSRGAAGEAAAQGARTTWRGPGRSPSDDRRTGRRCGTRPVPALSAAYPRSSARHGREVVPAASLRLGGRLHADGTFGGALPARPGRVPWARDADHPAPRAALPRVARLSQEYRDALGDITSPERWKAPAPGRTR